MPASQRILIVLLLCASCAAQGEITPQRQQELLYLLHQDCGACHGITLKGGLGPALLPRRLAAYSQAFITQTILKGRPGTPMPPWSPFMTEQEAHWLAGRLQAGVTP